MALLSRRQRQVLTVLAMRRDEVVPVDMIAHLVWGDELPSDPAATVQTHISRLRRIVGEEVDIATHPNGYRLVCSVHDVDACHFEWLVERMRTAPGEHSTRLAAEALELWRGLPFPDLDHPDAEPERQRLVELRMETLDSYAEALSALGRYAEAIALADQQVREHPYRERCRRHTDALALCVGASGRGVGRRHRPAGPAAGGPRHGSVPRGAPTGA